MHSFEDAEVSPTAQIGSGTKIWANSKICDGVMIGENCNVGRAVYIGPGVTIGRSTKIQNNSLIYEPASLGAGVFIGPSVVITNDLNPRAVNPDHSYKTDSDWEKVGVIIEEGASIGAGAICIAPVKIGRWSMVGSGSIVTKDVPNYALVVGNPAKQIGWVGMAGFRLVPLSEDSFQCPKTREVYRFKSGQLEIAPNSNT